MSDTVLGCIILLTVAAVATVTCLYYSRRVDRLTPEEQKELKKRWSAGGSGGGNAGCGGGCGGG